ncbi:MAG: Flp family type IVb pilin [Chloroflexi bacterium]|nr:Flp family type IVb pilin [Chloroflexota bacterium]
MWPEVMTLLARDWLVKHAGRSGLGQRGQSMVEYAMIAALIAVAALAAIQALGGGIIQVFQNILNAIAGLGA